jgi:hypothetical protein
MWNAAFDKLRRGKVEKIKKVGRVGGGKSECGSGKNKEGGKKNLD